MINKRNRYLDFIKAILIYFVVLGHSIQYISYNSSSLFWDDYLFKTIYAFHMQLFIALSGYFTYFSLSQKSIFNFFKDRFCKLFLPMISWCLLIFIIQSMILKKIFLNNLFNIIELNYWFIWALLLFSVIACCIKKFNLDNVLIWLISIPIVISLPFDMFLYPWIKSIYSFFVIGYLAAKVNLSNIILWLKKCYILIFALSILFVIIYPRNAFFYITPSSLFEIKITLLRFITAFSCSISFLFGVYFIYAKLLKQNVNSLLLHIGRNTLNIYLIQGMFFYFYGIKKVSIFRDLIYNDYVSFLMSIVLFLVFYCTIILLSKQMIIKKIFLG